MPVTAARSSSEVPHTRLQNRRGPGERAIRDRLARPAAAGRRMDFRIFLYHFANNP